MGNVLNLLSKDIVFSDNDAAIRYPKIMDPRQEKVGYRSGEYHNSSDDPQPFNPAPLITAGTSLIGDILGYATGTTQQNAASQQMAAQAALEQARASQYAASKKSNAPLIIGLTVGGLAITTITVVAIIYHRRKNRGK